MPSGTIPSPNTSQVHCHSATELCNWIPAPESPTPPPLFVTHRVEAEPVGQCPEQPHANPPFWSTCSSSSHPCKFACATNPTCKRHDFLSPSLEMTPTLQHSAQSLPRHGACGSSTPEGTAPIGNPAPSTTPWDGHSAVALQSPTPPHR